jgi:hypothetical protein
MGKRIETVEDMRAALLANDRILAHAVLALYECQEADEQASQATRHRNGMGFDGRDAYILSSYARQVMERKEEEKAGTLPAGYGLLSPKQAAVARRKMPKYAQQLLGLAASRTRAEEPAQPAPVAPAVPINVRTGQRFFCCDCGKAADLMAWETSLCHGCFAERERGDVLLNRARNDKAMATHDKAAWEERVQQAQTARLDSPTCDCGQAVTGEWNGLPVCSDCGNDKARTEQGRRYREEKRLLKEQAEAVAAEGGRPSLVVQEGDGIRFMTPKEQHAAGYRLDLRTGKPHQPTRLQESDSDPFGEIPGVYCVA